MHLCLRYILYKLCFFSFHHAMHHMLELHKNMYIYVVIISIILHTHRLVDIMHP